MSLTILTNVSESDALAQMRRLTLDGIKSPYVRELVGRAVSVSNNPDIIAAVYDYVKTTFPYMPDPVGKELFIAPNRIAEDHLKSGKIYYIDCDDYAMFLAALLGSAGYRTRITVVSYSLSGELEHAYAEVYVNEMWVPVDPANIKRPLGWFKPTARSIYIEF